MFILYSANSKCKMFCYALMIVVSITACKKEPHPEVSDKDKNYFVVSDNPNDLVDHAMFKFYDSTGIASFYNDTIHARKVSNGVGAIDRYAYVKLAFTYNIQGGGTALGFKYLEAKERIPGVLNFIKEDVLPKIPNTSIIPSIFLVDSFWVSTQLTLIQIKHGFTSVYGMNTLGIQVKEVASMNPDQKRMYCASLLAGIAEKQVNQKHRAKLQSSFYNVSANLAKSFVPSGFYSGFPYLFYLAADKVPAPEDIGLLYHPIHYVLNANNIVTPTEQYDLRAFLTAAFRYTEDEFEAMYTGKTGVITKYHTIRNILEELDFKVP